MTPSKNTQPDVPSCPSAQAWAEDAEVFGVVTGTVDAPRVEYLSEAVPVTPDLLSHIGPNRAGEVLRVRAKCVEGGCVHFADHRCTLGERIAALPHEGASKLPPCAIRATCRWFAEQGKSACLRCPEIVTEVVAPVRRLDLRVYLPVLGAPRAH
jgi:hypothetical protein